MPLTTAIFLGHLAACTQVYPVIKEAPVERALAVAKTESSLQPLAIHDNTTGKTFYPATPEAALTQLAALRGHSLDAGIMAVNNANWPAYGLTAETVFDPRANICAGARILAEGYRIERRAACRYNTGRPDCTNGYPEAVARRVEVIPVATPVGVCGPAPSWDGWAMSAHLKCLKEHKP